MKRLKGKRIAFLVADLTHDEEYAFPRYWLKWEGADCVTVGVYKQHTSRFGRPLIPDMTIDEANSEDFDAVVIPGGFGPDKMRTNEKVLQFVKDMMEKGKVVAAICHGPQVLISAGLVRGRKLTCVKNVSIDVMNAGGNYIDEPVVVDGNLITSRHPYDLPGFTEAIIKALT
jgi:protease I